MKIAECTCRECELEFKITFKDDYPELIHCPHCTGIFIKLDWLDKDNND